MYHSLNYRNRMGKRLRWFRAQVPVGRKPVATTVLLGLMAASLIFIPQPFGIGGFSLGVLVLGSDYKIVQMLSMERPYRWIQSEDSIKKEVMRDYRTKVFIDRGPSEIELQLQSEGNFRATIEQHTECIFPGLIFRIYVEAPLDEDRDLQYHLRLGTAEVTRVSEMRESSVTVFFTVIEWETSFEDNEERLFAKDAISKIQNKNEGDLQAFAKIAETERVNEFGVEEWRAIYDWAVDDEPDSSS